MYTRVIILILLAKLIKPQSNLWLNIIKLSIHGISSKISNLVSILVIVVQKKIAKTITNFLL